MIRNLLAPMKVGDPVVLRKNGSVIYGRVARLEGHQFGGEFPIIVLRTPGGSEVKAGRIWIAPITTPEDAAALAGFEAMESRGDASGEKR